MRQVLDEEMSIKNGLDDDDRRHLAAAMDSGRYLMFIGYIDKTQYPDDVQWRYHAVDFPDNVIRESPTVLLKHLGDATRTERQMSQTRGITLQGGTDAIPDLGE